MKERPFLIETKRRLRHWQARGLLVLALVTAVVSCAPSIQATEVSFGELPSSIGKACSEANNDVCQILLVPFPTDLYPYSRKVILWDSQRSPLNLEGYQVFPSKEPCSNDSRTLPAKRIEGAHLVG